MPQPPARQARRGTTFHLWLEERFGQQRLIDDDDLFADGGDEDPDENLIELKARFEAGAWGGRWPRQTEVPFDMLIGDRQVRGRIDAVFAGPDDGSFDVVDWKTGQPPRGKAEKDAVAVQLAAYRLAWSALADVPLGGVRAAFYYVRHDRTVRPADLLDEAGLVALINGVPTTVRVLPFDHPHLRLGVMAAGRRGHVVELLDLLLGQLDRVGGDVLLDPGDAPGAGDRRDVVALGEQPGDGDLRGRGAGLGRDGLDLLHQAQIVLEVLAGETGVARP
jgi:DNA helicase-2/ATP-dependent DNA helicase PcrA